MDLWLPTIQRGGMASVPRTACVFLVLFSGTVQYSTVLHSSAQCIPVKSCAWFMRPVTVRFSAVLHSTVLDTKAPKYLNAFVVAPRLREHCWQVFTREEPHDMCIARSTVLYCTVLYCTVQYGVQ